LNWRVEVALVLDFAGFNDHPNNGGDEKHDYSGKDVSWPFVSRLFIGHIQIVPDEFRRFNDVNLES